FDQLAASDLQADVRCEALCVDVPRFVREQQTSEEARHFCAWYFRPKPPVRPPVSFAAGPLAPRICFAWRPQSSEKCRYSFGVAPVGGFLREEDGLDLSLTLEGYEELARVPHLVGRGNEQNVVRLNAQPVLLRRRPDHGHVIEPAAELVRSIGDVPEPQLKIR